MKKIGGEEVDYKLKSGTAWSHSYLNQKPWHPLSYPNQRRKWIAEQTHAQHERRTEEVSREFAQEQEFFRQTAAMSKKEKEKVEAMQAVGFMYMRPPGYNAESARAAEIADERKKLGLDSLPGSSCNTSLAAVQQGETDIVGSEKVGEGRRKPRVKDVFGRTLPTEEEFPALKDAPRLETGVAGRVKPFAIEIRNVKCARCGAFGHQSGDRECPLKDIIMPNEEERLKRNDPLTVILAQAMPDEPLKWELKRQPGVLSPARGGFRPDDPNQQILPDDDIYDEYGGFLAGAGEGESGLLAIPDVLASLTKAQRKELAGLRKDAKRHRKRKDQKRKRKHLSDSDDSESESNSRDRNCKKERRSEVKHKKEKYSQRKSRRAGEKERNRKRHHATRDSQSSDTSSRPDSAFPPSADMENDDQPLKGASNNHLTLSIDGSADLDSRVPQEGQHSRKSRKTKHELLEGSNVDGGSSTVKDRHRSNYRETGRGTHRGDLECKGDESEMPMERARSHQRNGSEGRHRRRH